MMELNALACVIDKNFMQAEITQNFMGLAFINTCT